MRIIEPSKIKYANSKKSSKDRKKIGMRIFVLLVLIIGLAVGVGFMAYNLSTPSLKPSTTLTETDAQPINLNWPVYGQAAVGASGYGVLSQHNSNKPVPIASVAKVMTALAVLNARPLKLGEAGPTITLTDNDVQIYNNYAAQNGSVVAVNGGETLTERQALEAMLLPSANNIADSLAIWAFGSLKNYNNYATMLAKRLGLNDTHITDASGFSPSTTSTATDLVTLGLEALKNPTLAQIFNEQSADIPVVGTVTNVNYKLGQDGLVGIKTGNTDEAGGCFLLASKRQYGNLNITRVIAVLGAPNLATAMNDGLRLLSSASEGFGIKRVVSKGSQVGKYVQTDGPDVVVVAGRDIDMFGWLGKSIEVSVNLDKLSYPVKANQVVGSVIVSGHTVPAITTSNVAKPGIIERFKSWL